MEFTIYRAKEKDLVNGCLRRDPTAQQQLFDLYSSKMYAICYRYVRHRMQAEDILIMGFTKVFDRIRQFNGEGSFEAWVRRIMINEALGYLRKNRSMYLETDLEQADGQPDYDRLQGQLEAEDLLKLIARLPPGYGLVFNLYAIDGYTHKEISEQLGISENTSKSQLSRARHYLQKLLLEYTREFNRKISHDEATT